MEEVNVQAIQSVESDAQSLAELANGIQVTCQAEADEANQVLIKINTGLKQAETKRKSITGPINESLRRINEMVKTAIAPAIEAKAHLSQRLMAWRAIEQRKIREQEEAARREEERRRKIQEAHKEKGHEVREEITPVPKPEPLAARDTTKVRKDWDFKVTNMQQVPIEYLEINSPAIRQAIREGIREIPGIEIFQKEVPIYA